MTKTSSVWFITKVKLQSINDTCRLAPGPNGLVVSLLFCNFTFVIYQTGDVFVTITVIQISGIHCMMFHFPSVVYKNQHLPNENDRDEINQN